MMNSELPCGCVMTRNEITFSKKIYEEDGRTIKDTVYVRHRHRNLVNICDKCGFKKEMRNNLIYLWVMILIQGVILIVHTENCLKGFC